MMPDTAILPDTRYDAIDTLMPASYAEGRYAAAAIRDAYALLRHFAISFTPLMQSRHYASDVDISSLAAERRYAVDMFSPMPRAIHRLMLMFRYAAEC